MISKRDDITGFHGIKLQEAKSIYRNRSSNNGRCITECYTVYYVYVPDVLGKPRIKNYGDYLLREPRAYNPTECQTSSCIIKGGYVVTIIEKGRSAPTGKDVFDQETGKQLAHADAERRAIEHINAWFIDTRYKAGCMFNAFNAKYVFARDSDVEFRRKHLLKHKSKTDN